MSKQPKFFTDYELKLRGVLQEAIRGWPQLDLDSSQASESELYISGADLLEWFARWRQTAIDAIYDKPTTTPAPTTAHVKRKVWLVEYNGHHWEHTIDGYASQQAAECAAAAVVEQIVEGVVLDPPADRVTSSNWREVAERIQGRDDQLTVHEIEVEFDK
jgi:hypothetical protein